MISRKGRPRGSGPWLMGAMTDCRACRPATTPGRVRRGARMAACGSRCSPVWYAQLPPDHYRFQVRACNSDGVWNETGAALDLTADPYWWETSWFRVFAPLAAAGLLAGGILLGLRRRHRHQIERLKLLQATERERARIARDLHDDLGSHPTRIVMLSDSEPGSREDPTAGHAVRHDHRL